MTKETFDCVQQEMLKRQELRSAGETGNGRYSGKYEFSGKIVCGECGETYRRHQQYNKYKKYYIWTCKRHENQGKQFCPAKPLKEESLKKAFVRALNGLMENKEEILERIKNEATAAVSDTVNGRLAKIEEQIQTAQNGIMARLTDKQNGKITEEEYARAVKTLMCEIDTLGLDREEVLNEQGKMRLAEYRKEEIARLLGTGELIDEFDETVFKSLVREMKVVGDKEIEIAFECGVIVKEIVE